MARDVELPLAATGALEIDVIEVEEGFAFERRLFGGEERPDVDAVERVPGFGSAQLGDGGMEDP
jgi:hypothetical protein